MNEPTLSLIPRPRSWALVAPLLLSACVTPVQTRRPALDRDPAVAAAADHLAAPAAAWAEEAWWTSFGDPQLDRIVNVALAANPDLDTAKARAREAAANAGLVAARRQPGVEGVARVNRQRLSENGLVPPPFGGRWIR